MRFKSLAISLLGILSTAAPMPLGERSTLEELVDTKTVLHSAQGISCPAGRWYLSRARLPSSAQPRPSTATFQTILTPWTFRAASTYGHRGWLLPPCPRTLKWIINRSQAYTQEWR
jgi:hypothetical protein